ncbi:hypothetical protein VKT23_008556 [Stygiomarasmius scandens]|uniref:A to I editase domain-containing protein n=1 Tax=Marasmiellus scandens TaxID=2682957 RepID=A0ABR1JMW4_9AGAR
MVEKFAYRQLMFVSSHHDEAVKQILGVYFSLKISPPTSQWTILASLFLTNNVTGAIKPISIATGTKCLPTSRYPLQGEALHDSHAEVLARRAATRWFLEEILREAAGVESKWISRRGDGKYALQESVRVILR